VRAETFEAQRVAHVVSYVGGSMLRTPLIVVVGERYFAWTLMTRRVVCPAVMRTALGWMGVRVPTLRV